MEVMRGYAMSAKTTRVRVLRRMSVAVLAVLAAVVLMPSRAGASVMTMADLLSGASIQSGDKLFYGFSDYSSNASGGATSVDPATIHVLPTLQGNEWGLLFQSAYFYAGSGQSQDTHFDFLMQVTDPTRLATDNSMQMTSGVHGSGSRATIAEDIWDLSDNTLLAQDSVNVLSTGGNGYDHEVFLYPVDEIHVSKDIALVGGAGVGSYAFISDLSQTFSQTPEPGTLALLGLGALGFLPRRRRGTRR